MRNVIGSRAWLVVWFVSSTACGGGVGEDGRGGPDPAADTPSFVLAVELAHGDYGLGMRAPWAGIAATSVPSAARHELDSCLVQEARGDSSAEVPASIDLGAVYVATAEHRDSLSFADGRYVGSWLGAPWRDGERLRVLGVGNERLPRFDVVVEAARAVAIKSPTSSTMPTPRTLDEPFELRWTPADQAIDAWLFSTDIVSKTEPARTRTALCHLEGGARTVPTSVVRWVFEPGWSPTLRGWRAGASSVARAPGGVVVVSTTLALDSNGEPITDWIPLDLR